MFTGKVVVITGAGSGIGRALAEEFAVQGAHLALADFDVAALDETMAALPTAIKSKAYPLNVAERVCVEKFAGDVERDFGAAHYIINNAGTSVFASVEQATIEEFEKVIAVNLWGVIYGTKAFLPIMLRQKEGCIVNVSSVFGLLATPCSAPYTISKFGVRGLTETLWQELEGSGVRAVVVHPGGINTNIRNVPDGENCGDAGRKIKAANIRQMTTSPRDCAVQIIDGLKSGKPRLLVGNGAKALFWISRIFPNSYGRLISKKLGL